MENSQYEKLVKLNKYFADNLRPLLIIATRQYKKLPSYFLSQIRNYNDHVGRIFVNNNPNIDDELCAAEGHLHRATLDCYKRLFMDIEIGINEFNRRYRFISLSDIDKGNFLKKFYDLLYRARNFTESGRLTEGYGDRKEAVDSYGKALEEYYRLAELIKLSEKRDGVLRKASVRNKKNFIFAILGSAASAVTLFWLVKGIMWLLIYFRFFG